MDEFFDVLYDEPLDRWYEIGNVIAIVDHQMQRSGTDLSDEAKFFLMSQTACAGMLVPSHIRGDDQFDPENTKAFMNGIMKAFRCSRQFDDRDILAKDWSHLTDCDFEKISSCGYFSADHIKLPLEDDNSFSSLYFLDLPFPLIKAEEIITQLFQDNRMGKIIRIKGFHCEQGQWYELNASRSKITVEKCSAGQELFIVIGENLNKEAIRLMLGVADDVWHNGNVYAGNHGGGEE